MKLIQLSDFHLLEDPTAEHRGVNPEQRLDFILQHIGENQLDAAGLLLTGDLAQQPSAKVYARMAGKLNALTLPWASLPGNHDDAALLAAASPAVTELGQRLSATGWTLTLLDSNPPLGTDAEAALGAGLLAVEQLDYLRQRLVAHAGPHLVAMHHNPFPLAGSWQQRISLQNSADVINLLNTSERNGVVLCGHIHHARELSLASGWRALSCPATAAQFQPDTAEFGLETAAPAAWPAYRCLHLQAEGRLESYVQYVRPV